MSMFPLVWLDPLQILHHKSNRRTSNAIAVVLARSLRIQTTLVVLDGMTRSDVAFDFGDAEHHLLEGVGISIEQMLSLSMAFGDNQDDLSKPSNTSAALVPFDKLQTIRKMVIDLSNMVRLPDPRLPELRDHESAVFKRSLILGEDESGARFGIPKLLSERHNRKPFSLQLVEHLILRSMCLFQA